MPWTPSLFFAAGLSSALAGPAARNLLDEQLAWRVVNDGVMGGRSSGEITRSGGTVTFTGELSLENNGGFASARTAPDDLKLGEAEGLRVTVRGDGRTWWFTLRRRDQANAPGSYRVALPTTNGEETTVTVAFADFSYAAYGRPVAGVPPLSADPSAIASLGVLLADKQAGPFTLEVLSVTPVSAEAVAPTVADAATREAAKLSLAAAIRLGVPAYNGGDPGKCRAHYQTAIESALMLARDGLTPSEQAALVVALQQGERASDDEAAWIYRRAMDAVLAR